jgi:hypothetical protein
MTGRLSECGRLHSCSPAPGEPIATCHECWTSQETVPQDEEGCSIAETARKTDCHKLQAMLTFQSLLSWLLSSVSAKRQRRTVPWERGPRQAMMADREESGLERLPRCFIPQQGKKPLLTNLANWREMYHKTEDDGPLRWGHHHNGPSGMQPAARFSGVGTKRSPF